MNELSVIKLERVGYSPQLFRLEPLHTFDVQDRQIISDFITKRVLSYTYDPRMGSSLYKLHLIPGHPDHYIWGEQSGHVLKWSDVKACRVTWWLLEWVEYLRNWEHAEKCVLLKDQGYISQDHSTSTSHQVKYTERRNTKHIYYYPILQNESCSKYYTLYLKIMYTPPVTTKWSEGWSYYD